MKKYLFFTFLILFVSSCTLTRINKKYRSDINGSWILKNITYSGNSGVFKLKIFDESDAESFKESLWTFNSNNSIGSYTFKNKANGPSIARQLRWSVYLPENADAMLQFKKIDPSSKKSLDNQAGYRLYIDYLSPIQMRLRTRVSFEGRPFDILYDFTKN